MGLGPAVVVIRGGASAAVVAGVTVDMGVATGVVGPSGRGVEVVWAVVGAAVDVVEVKDTDAFVKLEALEGPASIANWCESHGVRMAYRDWEVSDANLHTCSWTVRIISINREPIPIDAIRVESEHTCHKWLVSARF